MREHLHDVDAVVEARPKADRAEDPSSDSGKHMLAHELTHVVQQRSGPVDGTDASDGVRVSDPSDRFEREASANADRAMSAPSPADRPAAQAPAVQRHADEAEAQ